LGVGDAPHAVPQPTVSKAVLTHGEALPESTEDVLVGYYQVVDSHLGVTHLDLVPIVRNVALAHDRDIADDLEAVTGKLDQEGGVLLMARSVGIGLGHHQRQL
jgi:hypothetical protein